jgi:hypothetical protein
VDQPLLDIDYVVGLHVFHISQVVDVIFMGKLILVFVLLQKMLTLLVFIPYLLLSKINQSLLFFVTWADMVGYIY